MKKQMRYSPEIRERAVRLLHEHQKDYESQWAAILSIASKVTLNYFLCKGNEFSLHKTLCHVRVVEKIMHKEI